LGSASGPELGTAAIPSSATGVLHSPPLCCSLMFGEDAAHYHRHRLEYRSVIQSGSAYTLKAYARLETPWILTAQDRHNSGHHAVASTVTISRGYSRTYNAIPLIPPTVSPALSDMRSSPQGRFIHRNNRFVAYPTCRSSIAFPHRSEDFRHSLRIGVWRFLLRHRLLHACSTQAMMP